MAKPEQAAVMWQILENQRPEVINGNKGTVSPDMVRLGEFMVQLLYRGEMLEPNRRPYVVPEIRARVSNPSNTDQFTRPAVLCVGRGGATRIAGTNRDAILEEIIGWTREQTVANRGKLLRLRLTEPSAFPQAGNEFVIATWNNLIDYLIGYHQSSDSAFSRLLERYRTRLKQESWELIMAGGDELKNLRIRIAQETGASRRFLGTGRLKDCNEYLIDPKVFYSAAGVEITLPDLY